MSKPDYKAWLRRDLWTLMDASFLLADYEPARPDPVIESLRDMDLPDPVGRIYEDLKNAIDLKKLEFIESRTGWIGNRRVKPSAVVVWHQARGNLIPDGFGELAERKAHAEVGTLERNTLLRLIAVLAVKGYGFDPNAKRLEKLGDLANDAEQLGVPFDDNTLRKWLRAAFKELDREARKP